MRCDPPGTGRRIWPNLAKKLNKEEFQIDIDKNRKTRYISKIEEIMENRQSFSVEYFNSKCGTE